MLDKKQKYLQIALNSNLRDARLIINQIPPDRRIIIEAGTPLIKKYGSEGIRKVKSWWEQKVFTFLIASEPYFLIKGVPASIIILLSGGI